MTVWIQSRKWLCYKFEVRLETHKSFFKSAFSIASNPLFFCTKEPQRPVLRMGRLVLKLEVCLTPRMRNPFFITQLVEVEQIFESLFGLLHRVSGHLVFGGQTPLNVFLHVLPWKEDIRVLWVDVRLLNHVSPIFIFLFTCEQVFFQNWINGYFFRQENRNISNIS